MTSQISSLEAVEGDAVGGEEPCTEEKVEEEAVEAQDSEDDAEEPEVPLSGAAARKAAAQRVKYNSARASGGKKVDPKLAARKAHLDALLNKNPDEVVEGAACAAGPGAGPVKLTSEDLKRMEKDKVRAFRMQEEYGSRVRIKP